MRIFIFTSGLTASNCIIINKFLEDKSIDVNGIFFSLPNGGDNGFLFRFKRLLNYGIINLVKILCQKFSYSNKFEKKHINSFNKHIKKQNIELFYKDDFEICLDKARQNSDLTILVYFNRIIKRKYISKKFKIINIHPSYLPNYRGVQPVFWSLYNNENEIGASIHLVDSGIDSGPIYKQFKIPRKTKSININMFNISKEISNQVVVIIKMIINNTLIPIHQMEDKGSYYSRPKKNEINLFLKNNRYF